MVLFFRGIFCDILLQFFEYNITLQLLVQAVFHVTDADGKKLTDEGVIWCIQKVLMVSIDLVHKIRSNFTI